MIVDFYRMADVARSAQGPKSCGSNHSMAMCQSQADAKERDIHPGENTIGGRGKSLEKDVNDSRGKADSRAAQGHLADVVQQCRLTQRVGQARVARPDVDGRQVSLVMWVQRLEHARNGFVREKSRIEIWGAPNLQRQSNLVQAMQEGRGGQKRKK